MRILLPIVALSCLLAACSSTSPQATDYNDLKKGMSRQEASVIAGVPAFDSRRGSGEVWFYQQDKNWQSDWIITREDCMPVVLRSDHVIGWGQEVRAEAGLIAYGNKPPLKFGMSKKDIERFIGDPVFTDHFGNREALYYALSATGERPEKPTRENTWPVLLIDGVLTRWGEEAAADAAKVTAGEKP